MSNGYRPDTRPCGRKDTMFSKGSMFYADWRDASGKRMRKAFKSKRAALQFESEQKELAHPKTPARPTQSPRFCAPALTGPGDSKATKSKLIKR